MAKILLHGDLAKFGEVFELDVASAAEAVRALCAQIKGFRRRLTEGHFCIRRERNGSTRDLDLERLGLGLKHGSILHFVPVAAGSKNGSGKALIGVAIVAAAFTMGAGAFVAAGDMALTTTAMHATAFSVAGFGITFSQIAGFGAMMILGGVAQMLSPTPKASSYSSAKSSTSGMFSGPVNVSAEGSAVPLVFGRFICGSVVISSSLNSEAIPV